MKDCYDIIGDIHGCFHELKQLTLQLGYTWDTGVPVYPKDRKLVFLGDLTDRGPNSVGVIEMVWDLVYAQKNALYCPGNHCDKLYRYFKGNKVKINNGLETTVAELENLTNKRRTDIKRKFMQLFEDAPLYLQLANEKLVVAHAGINEGLIGKSGKKVRTFVLYGDITGEVHEDGSPVRRDWAEKYKGSATIVYGHTPVRQVRKINNTYNIDTGAVFGGMLTCLKYPEMELVSIPSTMPTFNEKFRTFD